MVVRADGLILARPLSKFFNLEQIKTTLPWDKPLEITTKLDGSCIIHSNDITVTRGSFTSTQAQWSKELLSEYNASFDPNITYIFELLHPENRIVCFYGNEKKLVLLAMIETATGKELPLDYNLGIEVVQFHHLENISDGSELRALEKTNEEGFVVKFYDNTRIKIKFAEYCRLHRIVTGTSSKSIWSALRNGDSLNELLENIPDEFNQFVKTTIKELEHKYDEIEKEALVLYDKVKDLPSRKEQALTLQVMKSRATFAVFKMLDNKSYSDGIWKLCEPEFYSPFASRDSI